MTLLARRGFIVFMPILGDADVDTLEPMFPGYVFVAVNRQVEELLPRARVSGFRQFVGGGATGQPVPVGEVEKLIARVDADGIIRSGAAPNPGVRVANGDTVRVVNGPFRSLTGAVQSSATDRVNILLSVMGREAKVTIPRGDVVPA